MPAFADHFLPPEAPELLRRVAEYWNARRGTRLMPSFDDLDPTGMPWALSRIYVLRVRTAEEFVYRLAGEEVARPYGRPLRGARISDLLPEASARMIQRRWSRVAREPACCYTNSEHPSTNGRFIAAQRLTMPLGSNGWKADHVLGVACSQSISLDAEPTIEGAIIRSVIWRNLATDRVSVEMPSQ